MSMSQSRRNFLKGTAALTGALVIGLDSDATFAAVNEDAFIPNPFVKIFPNNKIVVIAKHFEMGQGTTTGLATLIAEELEADWNTIEVEWAPADKETYNNPALDMQGTGASTSMANSFDQYRKAGAAAKEIMIKAAAKEWDLPEAEIEAKNNTVTHPSGKKAYYGDLIKSATGIKLENEPKLKDPSNFTIIGKKDLPRKDAEHKTSGTAVYALDVKVPDMVYVMIARQPYFGAKIKAFDDTKTRKIKGVVEVKQIPTGIAVYAKNTTAAIKGRTALKIEWDISKAERRSSAEMFEEYEKKLETPGLEARKEGDPEKALKSASKTVSALFKFPFLAHTPMEPLNCVLKYDGKSAELWDGCQMPSIAQKTIADILELEPEKVKINTVYAGGSFGRRASQQADYQAEAAMAAKAIDGKWPVKLLWMRDDDVKGGNYRPMFVEKIDAGIDGEGNIIAWQHKLAGKSIHTGTYLEKALVRKDGLDNASVEGAKEIPYDIPNILVDCRNMQTPIPVMWWRSVGHSHTAYAKEVAIDIIANELKQDPVEFRLKLLENHPRLANTLKLAADKAGWENEMPFGKGRGVAVHESFGTYVTLIAEVSLVSGAELKVDRIVCGVDCGLVVNPDIVTAQMEGAVGYAISAAMSNEITFKKGRVKQYNFPDYIPLRIRSMPKVDVHIVPSAEKPTGIGEPGVPPTAPAIANAIFATTGKRIFELPFSKANIKFAGAF